MGSVAHNIKLILVQYLFPMRLVFFHSGFCEPVLDSSSLMRFRSHWIALHFQKQDTKSTMEPRILMFNPKVSLES